MGDGWRRAVEAAKESRHGLCPFCHMPYTERNKNRYRHFDRHTGMVSWCKPMPTTQKDDSVKGGNCG